MYQVLRIVDRISFVFALLAVALFGLLVLDMMYEVVARRVFSSPTLWAFDIAYMSNGAIFLLAAGYTLLHNEHIRIDFLSTQLPRKVQDAVNILAYLFLFWFLWYAAAGAINEFVIAYQTGELEPTSPWAPKIWPFYLGIMLGICVFFLQCMAQCVKHALSLMGRGPSPLDMRGGDTPVESV
jgi:TRAP-type mannitol/chloroaromatic compound transport system permease small subunit